MKVLLELYSTFFKIGLFTFGGGYAMLPLLHKEVSEVKEWVSDEEILNFYAIGQSTPGIIAINTSTFIGYKIKGILGAIAATLGMITPSILIITLLATILTKLLEYEIVSHMLAGIRVAVVALIIHAVVKMWRKSVKDWIGIIFFLLAFFVVGFMGVSPLYIVMISIVSGILIHKLRVQKTK